MPYIPEEETALPCDALCLHSDHLASCRDRVIWVAQREFKSEGAEEAEARTRSPCGLAFDLVLEQCPETCGPCSFQEVHCSALSAPQVALPYECGVEPENLWDSAKRAWCCEKEAIGCPPTVTTPPLPVHEFLCTDGDAASWQQAKAVWCCENMGLGCSSFSCHAEGDAFEAPGWDSWSKEQKMWCFTHDRPFSRLYTCEDTGLLWEREWPDSKKAWCCYFDATWRADKEQWCCEGEGFLCSHVFGALPSKSLARFELLDELVSLVNHHFYALVAAAAAAACAMTIALLLWHREKWVPKGVSYESVEHAHLEQNHRILRDLARNRDGVRDMAMSTTGDQFAL